MDGKADAVQGSIVVDIKTTESLQTVEGFQTVEGVIRAYFKDRKVFDAYKAGQQAMQAEVRKIVARTPSATPPIMQPLALAIRKLFRGMDRVKDFI